MNTPSTQTLSKTLNLDGLRTANELKKAGFSAFKVAATHGKGEFVRRFVAKPKGAKKPVSYAYQYAKGEYEEEQNYTDTLKVVARRNADIIKKVEDNFHTRLSNKAPRVKNKAVV